MDDRLRQMLQAREPVVGAWHLIGHPVVAEVTAGLGFDFSVLDTEHPPYSLETLDTMVASIAAADGNTLPIVRVPLAEENRVTRVLNVGAAGILFPEIDSASAAEAAASATRYPPEGTRTIAPGRGSDYLEGFEDYVETANDAVTTIAMIESEEAVDNAREIASVDGVDAILIGHEDLSADLGIFAQWEHDRLQDAIDRVIAACDDAETAVGRVTPGSDSIPEQVERGYDYLVAGVDLWQLTNATREARETFDEVVDR